MPRRRGSDRLSWLTALSHRSVGRMHTRLSHVLADDRRDALSPNSKGYRFWSQLLLLCLVHEAFLLPFTISFQPHTTQLISILVFMCEAVFALDLFVQSNMGFYEHGNLIRDRSRTRHRYLRSKQLFLDVVALVPWQLFGPENAQLLAKLQLLKMLRCSRMPRLMAVVDELYTQYFVVLKLFKVLLATLYLAHVLACVRFSFGEDEQGTDPWLITPTWDHHSVLDHYFVSLFWSVGIMTGLFEGDVPRYSSEFVFTITVALCGFAMFTTLCGTIFVISKCESGNSEEVEARINQLVHVLSFHHVPERQQSQAVEYLKRYYADAVETDRESAKLLCPSISHDIQAERLRPIIASVELFKGCSDQFVTAVTTLLEMVAVPAHTKLFSRGSHGDAMYVAHSGVIAVVLKSVVVREIRKGSCFGELYAFSSLRCPATIISWTYATLYKLSRFHCERIVEAYPAYASVIAENIKESLGQLKDNKKGADTTIFRSTSLDNFAKSMSRQHSAPSRDALASSISRKGSLSWLPRKSVVIPMELDFQHPQHEQKDNGNRVGGTESTFTRDPKLPLTKLALSGGSYSLRSKTSITTEHIKKLGVLIVHKNTGLFGPKLFGTCIDHRSVVRMRWLLLTVFNLFYCWLTVPVQVVFPLWQRPSWIMLVADAISNAGFLLDIVLNFNLSYMVDSERVIEPKRTARRYFGDTFFFDLLCVFPCEYFDPSNYGLLRLPRLLCVYHLRKQLCEIKVFVTFNSRRQLWLLGLLLFMLCHVVTCIHFGISYGEGFDTNEETPWILPRSLCLRRLNSTHLDNCNGKIFDEETDRGLLRSISFLGYSRSLYYAVGVFTSPGKSVEPTSQAQLIVGVILMLSGFLISAIVVDNVQKRFTASALEQKQFFETRNRIQLFLRRQNAPLLIHHRVKSFLDYWWSSHRGAVVSELLADLPRSLRLELLLSICLPVLQTLGLLQGVHPVRDKLEKVLVESAEFILYGQGETIYHHGDYASGVFFLLQGEVRMVRERGLPFEIPRGSFFGAAALAQQERGEGYTENTSAISGCTLLFVARDQIQALEFIFPAFRAEFISLEQRILGNKWQSKHMSMSVEAQTPVAISSGLKRFLGAVYDPDSFFILAWETWIFFIMTIQWIQVVFVASFPLSNGHGYTDALMVFLEISFVVDICIRPRLGFYEYGNKIMSTRRIRREYLHSRAFALDIAAVLPLYIVNWNVSVLQRWELLNMNKLLRLLKVPRQLHALETRYLKHSTELHLFKLLYYTFMLSHFLGCIWFNFASKVAALNFSTANKDTAFGDDPWLPAKKLGDGSETLQYLASLYWSFGLMSSSGESELPRTTPECMFSIITMTSGFFLFAYVIGNFTDIIDLSSSEARDFNLKMSAVRQMLDYFTMPRALQERVKTFLMFKRYHTITQEQLLVDSLPPTLVTDIRLVYLKPMIEKVEFLAGMEVSITRMLVSQFAQLLVSRGEFVLKLGESGSDMFFIYAGVLDILLPAAKSTLKAVANVAGGKDADTDTEPGLTGPMELDIVGDNKVPLSFTEQLKKVGSLSDGKYFGENGLFTNSRRDVFVQAQTSCILYSLSRESLDLVFGKYPKWKQKVLRVANIHREQARLSQLSRKERRHGMQVVTDSELSPSDIVNERAEGFKDRKSLRGDNSKGRNRVLCSLLIPWHALMDGVAVQSSFHLLWLRFMVLCIAYVAIMIPYQLTMDSMDRTGVVTILCKVLELLCELAFGMDIWFSWHIQEAQASMELYDENLRSIYKKERMVWDVIAAFPFYDLLSLFKCSPWFKLLRCVKIVNIGTYVKELNRRHVSNEIMLFWHVWMGYLLVIYWITCAYLAVATEAGFVAQWKSWLPPKDLEVSDPQNPSPKQLIRRLLRAVFFAITAFVKKTYIPAPETAPLYAFHIAVSFVGLILMSIVIGELASLFISYIGLEVGFRKNHIAVELYLTRLGVSKELRTRSYAFMKSFWSAHAGVNYEELLSEMPRDIRVACVLLVSKQPLKWFVSKVVSPVCWEGDEAIDSLTLAIAEQLRFESYPRDENVVTEGNFIRAMYFVIKGHLTIESSSLRHRPVGLRGGSYFGERGLLGCTISAYSVRTLRACDLLSLSSEAFSQVLQKHPFSRLALRLCDHAYGYLKAQRLESCSKTDLEEHWGTAIQLGLEDIQRKSQEDLDVTLSSPEAGAALTSVDAFTSNFGNTATFVGKSAEVSRPSASKDVSTAGAKEKTHSELPTHLDEMVGALDSAVSCFEAFEPILHIVMATDPLDWRASFGASDSPSHHCGTTRRSTVNVRQATH